MRFFHGVFFSTAVIICEGWLNSKIDKENRSRMFGSYMTVNYICYGISQYILTVGAQTPYLALFFVGDMLDYVFAADVLDEIPRTAVTRRIQRRRRIVFA